MELPHEKIDRPRIENDFKRHFAAAEQAWQIALNVIKEGDKLGLARSSWFQICLCAVFVKQMRLFYSLTWLCRCGLGNEAQLPLRAMYEAALHLRAMELAEDKQEFARLWILWDYANYEKQVAKQLSRLPQLAGRFSELKAMLEPERTKMGTQWGLFRRYGPTKMSLASLADDLDRRTTGVKYKQTYDAFYPAASGTAHGYDLSFYAQPLEDGAIEAKLSPSEEYIEAVVISGVSLLTKSLSAINTLLELKKEKEIEALTSIVNSVSRGSN